MVDEQPSDPTYRVLFLCTGNSARSIMAECALNRWGRGRFETFRAGSHPKDEIHPITLQLLRQLNYQTDGLRSKAGMNSPGRMRRRSISCSRSVTRRPAKSALRGPASP